MLPGPGLGEGNIPPIGGDLQKSSFVSAGRNWSVVGKLFRMEKLSVNLVKTTLDILKQYSRYWIFILVEIFSRGMLHAKAMTDKIPTIRSESVGGPKTRYSDGIMLPSFRRNFVCR